jgi:hypothetical protein
MRGFSGALTGCAGLLLYLLCSGCSVQQGYAGAQNFQRNQCLQNPDISAREACLGGSDRSYAEYTKDVQGSTR